MTINPLVDIPPRTLAVWDFETLHDTIMELEYGPNWFRRFKADAHPPVINIAAIVESINEQTEESWHDAVADWQYFGVYASALMQYNVRPIQLFARSRSQSSRLGNYQETWMKRTPMVDGINGVIFLGITDRLAPMVRKSQTAGLKVIGINVTSADTQAVAELCDRFIDYGDIVSVKRGGADAPSLSEADRSTLLQAISTLQQRTGYPWIKQVRIKPAMVAINPAFDEKHLGYNSFSEFLLDQSDLLETRRFEDSREYEFSLQESAAPTPSRSHPQGQSNRQPLISLYRRMSVQQGLRLPNPELMWIGVDIYAAFVQDPDGFASFKELDDECLLQLHRDVPHATITDAKKIRQVLFKCYLFSPGSDDKIGFRTDVSTLEEVEELYFDLILHRIARHVPQPVDFQALSVACTGEPGSAERLSAQYAALEVE